MAVYTDLDSETLAAMIAGYDVGTLVSAKGIAEGISNSNWVIETRSANGPAGRFILTVYERRIDVGDIPFFLALLDHLAARGCSVPATIHDRTGGSLQQVAGKAAALIEFLPGVSPSSPTPAQARSVGAALAKVHLAAQDFPLDRSDRLDPAANCATLARCGPGELARIDQSLADLNGWAEHVVGNWPTALSRSIIHSDLFPDNVLMLGDRVTGLIDFYFACNGMMAYDLAVTHAAWAFDKSGANFLPSIGAALLDGYESIRELNAEERTALPLLAEGACLRFTASRAEDWLETSSSAQVTRKNPMDFVRRWRFYRDRGSSAFAKH